MKRLADNAHRDLSSGDSALVRRRFISGAVALFAAVAVPVIAQSSFFDVPFVPSPQVVVDEM